MNEGNPMAEPNAIYLTRYFPHPPAKIWVALTEPAHIANWWAPGNIRPVVGHRFVLDMGAWGQQQCEVLAVEHEKLISYTYAEGILNTTITWTLEAEGMGTRLTLVHSGFDLDSPIGKQAFEGMKNGWPVVLGRIGQLFITANG